MKEIKVRSHYGKKQYYVYAYDLYNNRKQLVSGTKEGVLKKLKKLEEEKILGLDSVTSKFGDYVYCHLTKVHYKELKLTTQERYMSSYNNHIKNSEIANVPMNKLTIETLQHWYDYMLENKGRSKLVGVDRIIRPCLTFAYLNGNIPKNFAGMLKIKSEDMEIQLLKLRRSNVRPLTMEEQLRFIKGIEGDKWEVLYRMALDGGYRKGELLALQWKDIDFTRKRIKIDKTYSYVKDPLDKDATYKVVITTPKSIKSVRTNRIPNILYTLLIDHKIKQKKSLELYGVEQNESSLVFSKPLGGYLNQTSVTKHLKKLYVKYGISSQKTFHDLRHTYATRQFEMGTPIPVVSALLGHSSVNETVKTYIHILDELKEATADATDQLYDRYLK